MKILKLIVLSMVAVGLLFSFAFAGDTAKGKALFNDPKFSGTTAGKSCNSCHPDGKGLEKAAEKKDFGKMGKSLEEAVNFCVGMMLKGKPIDAKSADMANIVAYIKSVKGK